MSIESSSQRKWLITFKHVHSDVVISFSEEGFDKNKRLKIERGYKHIIYTISLQREQITFFFHSKNQK